MKRHAAELETRDTGKPIVESEVDIADTVTCLEYYGGLATKVHGETLPVPDNALSFTLKEPVGVAALIVPWNYPLMLLAWKLGPALAAGCTVVVKPAEQTPRQKSATSIVASQDRLQAWVTVKGFGLPAKSFAPLLSRSDFRAVTYAKTTPVDDLRVVQIF